MFFDILITSDEVAPACRQAGVQIPSFALSFARMVELVDTLDLKSNDHCGRAGSSPAPSTKPSLWRVFFYKKGVNPNSFFPSVLLKTLALNYVLVIEG